MTTSQDNWTTWLTQSALVRNALDAMLRAHGRRHVAQADQLDPPRAQARALLGLVNRARKSRFGLDHDFRRIRSVSDFRRLVPIRALPDLVRTFGPLPATTPGLQTVFRSALFTLFAHAVHARPHARFLSGPIVVLDDVPSSVMGPRALARMPVLVRPYASAACGSDRHGNDDPLALLADLHARADVTTLLGSADKLLALIDRVKRIRAQDTVGRTWPSLQLVLWSRVGDPKTVSAFQAEMPSGVLALEWVVRQGVPVAGQDPRPGGGLRLLADHGVYFEFLPIEQAGERHPPRLGLDEVTPGRPYEVAISAPGGMWACRSGLAVEFIRSGATQLRLVQAETPGPRPIQPASGPLPVASLDIQPKVVGW